ncbi:MAG: metallophosphoesterase [Planctomycetes bacterium]|nr:metallophosphoesterase [Planctomycetota bacterium]
MANTLVEIPHASRESAQPRSAERRLGPECAARRRALEGRPQSMGQGKKLLPFQMLEPVMNSARRGLAAVRIYDLLARRATKLKIIEQRQWLARLPEALDGYRVLHLSDLHVDGFRGFGKRLAQACQDLAFDMVVVTGDLRLETRGSIDGALRELTDLAPALGCRHGIHAVLGNHDTLDMVEPLEALGFQYLLNESRIIDVDGEPLYLAGVDDAHFFGTDDLERALAQVPVDALSLLLCHSPDLIVEAAEAFVDLYLCGHTHGGQICLPGGHPLVSNASCARRFTGGPWLYGALRGHTSRGIGFSGIPWRSFCPGELIVHQLSCERRNRRRVRFDREESLRDPVFPRGKPERSSHDS